MAALLGASTASADFNPRGRTRTTKPKANPPAERPAPRAATKPAPQTQAPTTPDKPDDDALIKRYTGVVLSQPGAEFPLQRLAELYRKRDGHLDRLIAEFEGRAHGPKPPYNALVALAGIYRQAGQVERAVATYERAIEQNPNDSVGLMALAQLYQSQAQVARARAAFEQALPLLKVDADREQVLRVLMKLTLDVDDLAAARRFHEQLVGRAKGSFFVQAELGTELLQRAEYVHAEAEFRRLVQAARGDNRALAPALRDLGIALSRQGKHEEALKTLDRALAATSAQSGLRRQLLDVMVQVYRDADRLAEVVALLEKERATDFDRLRLLGGLYEEQGRIEDALAIYKKALAQKPKDLEVRLRLVQLLQLQGDLERATQEYKRLVQAAPHNPDFVFRLAEALLQRGQRDEAVRELLRLEQRARGDEQIQAALVDFYERVGEQARALALLEQLSRSQSTDPQHLVELGDRYFREGDVERAKRTWKRILVVVSSRSRALSILGDVYLDHDMPEEALETLREAVEISGGDERYEKALALALERAGAGAPKRVRLRRYEEALHLWEKLLVAGKDSPRLAREARRHIITLWGLGGTLERRIPPLERNMKTTPPDLASGRLLAEVYLRLKRVDDAERVLRKVVQHAPGDAPSLLLLERALVQQKKLAPALDVLKKLVKLQPDRAREFYQRMAQYSAEIYEDDDAIAYAAKAVELSPDDAAGHENLAEMYARRQNVERAIIEYRRAIEKNDRLFPAYFALAQLLLSQQRVDEADKLLRRVVRSAVDEELLMRAARASAQINLSRGSLESLERELLPLSLSNPQRPVYRRLLVEIYGSLTFPLVQDARSGDAQQRAAANAELERIGQRAVKPLLDALGDKRDAQQQIAVELLTHLRNGNASQPLFVYARGDGPSELRTRAMIAAGAPGKSDMLPQYEQFLFEGNTPRIDEGDPVVLAAVWGLCQIDGPRAHELVARLLHADSPTAQAAAAITLSLRGHRAAIPRLRELLDGSEHEGPARAAAAFAMGQLGERSAADDIAPLSESQDPHVQAAALLALTRLSDPRAHDAIVKGLVSTDAIVRRAAVGAAALVGGARYELASDPLGLPEGRVDAAALLAGLSPQPASPDDLARAVTRLEQPLTVAVEQSVRRSTAHAKVIGDALLARGDRPAFGALTTRLDAAADELRRAAERTLERVAGAAVGPYVALSSHPSVDVRTMATLVLSSRPEPAARDVLIQALADRDDRVRRLALGALSRRPNPDALSAVLRSLRRAEAWSERVHLIEALAGFAPLRGQQDSADELSATRDALEQLALSDPFSFVRQAALHSLWALEGERARAVLEQVQGSDPEARVRSTAAQLLRVRPAQDNAATVPPRRDDL